MRYEPDAHGFYFHCQKFTIWQRRNPWYRFVR